MALAGKALTLSARRSLRADFLEHLISNIPRGSIQGHMLAADAMVRFVETGEIVGLSPAVDDTPIVRRKPAGAAGRAR